MNVRPHNLNAYLFWLPVCLWLGLFALAGGLWVSAFAQKKLPPTQIAPSTSSTTSENKTFREVTREAGLARLRHTSGTQSEYIIEASGSGVAWFDYDNDGWQDIYWVNGGTMDTLKGKVPAPSSALLRNNRDGTFSDFTAKAGVANERFGQGVCAGDFDNDGWTDFAVTNYGKNRLYRNNGNGTFTDVAEQAGINVSQWSTGCAFGDYDGDGKLDLFIAGYLKLDLQNLPPAGSGGASNAANPQSEIRNPQSKGAMGASYSAGQPCLYRNTQVMCGPRGLPGAPDFLYHNDGNGKFSDVSVKAGVSDKAGYYGFGVAWFDMDDDGRLDLIVANDSTPNGVYRNLGNGVFEDVSYASGAALNEHGREQAHMGVDIGDYNGDGRADIHITNFADDTNVLYRNDGAGSFSDVTAAAGLGEVTIPFLGWGTNFLDYDNDGWLDLLVANGHVYPSVDQLDWNTSYRQRLMLLRNVKNRFADVNAGDALAVPRPTRGSAVADYDNDGDLDILLNNIGEMPTLLRNDANKTQHWLTLKLVGDPALKTPRDAIGTVVQTTINQRKLRGEVASGRSYVSQSDLRVHFGLGATAAPVRVNIRWANGKAQEFTIPTIDREVTITQGKGLKTAP
jgi:hypothetical protein